MGSIGVMGFGPKSAGRNGLLWKPSKGPNKSFGAILLFEKDTKFPDDIEVPRFSTDVEEGSCEQQLCALIEIRELIEQWIKNIEVEVKGEAEGEVKKDLK